MDHSSIPFGSLSLSSSFYGLTELDQPDFVELDVKYKCIVCHRFLREPMQTTCGHRLCRGCFEDCLHRSGPEGFMCPASEDECEVINREKVNPDFSAVREMGLQPVRCPNRKFGCPTQIQLKKLKEHLPQCEFVAVPCPATELGCPELMAKDAVEKHLAECKFRPVKCPHCLSTFSVCRMKEHTENECPEIVISCPFGCSERNLRRSQIEEHRGVCPVRPRDCKFRSVGCKFQGKETDVEGHSAAALREHLELAMIHIKQLELENSKLQGSVQKTLNESDSLRSRIAQLEAEIQRLEKTCQSVFCQVKQSEQNQLKLLASHSEKVLKLEDKMKALDSLVQEVGVVREKLAQQEHRIQTAGTPTPRLSYGLPEAMREQFVNHDRTIGIHDVRLAELSLRVQCIETTNHDGVLIWKICEYRRRRRDAVSGTTLSLYSQPFYSSRYGYKMCARVYLNGDGAGKGTHISFFFVVMQGDYDDILQWPFQQKVTLTLLDLRNNRRHVSDTFRPDPTSTSFLKPSSPMNVASGCPLFVPHTVIEYDDTYLKNDTLFFKVVVDTTDLFNP